MSVNQLPVCPTDCIGSLPDWSFNDCAPEVNNGEITKVYLARADAADFVNVDDAAEWNSRLSQTADTNNSIRTLVGIGELAAPEATEQEISKGRKVYVDRSFTMPFSLDETNETNYSAILALQCGSKFKIWFETSGGLLFGGNTGIEVSVKADVVIPVSRQELIKFPIEFSWKNKFSPLRTTSPLA